MRGWAHFTAQCRLPQIDSKLPVNGDTAIGNREKAKRENGKRETVKGGCAPSLSRKRLEEVCIASTAFHNILSPCRKSLYTSLVCVTEITDYIACDSHVDQPKYSSGGNSISVEAS